MENRNIALYPDESLESCLLRLGQHQGYDRFAHFAEECLCRFLEENEAVSGALPRELQRINVYHAQSSHQLRVRVLRQLEADLQLEPFSILKLALTRSDTHFSPEQRAVHRMGVDFPQAVLRTNNTPVCPQCLRHSPYSRQRWELLPYTACHIHGCELLHRCPECGKSCDFKYSEDITHCDCGFDFRDAQTKPANEASLWLSTILVVTEAEGYCLNDLDISARFGFLSWFLRSRSESDIDILGFYDYCREWPKNFRSELKEAIAKADQTRMKPWQQTSLDDVLGATLRDCLRLPYRDFKRNIVLSVLFDELLSAVSVPTSKSGGLGDVLVSVLDAAALLSCSTNRIYQLYEQGELKLATKVSLHSKLPSYQPAFTLRSILDTRLALLGTALNSSTNDCGQGGL
ncbi:MULTISPECIES: TniQ family protein [Echinimonadaceae]|uniref:TniQ family protein n=2 Tax=Echinimonadaceae TaxID=3046600 RepID=A0A8J6R1Z8_9GAMM|nr:MULTISPECIES: TniQ family protein [Echinimonadaceae]MBD1388390.1 TniQ family protein [Neiella litorisoli]MCM2679792.1 TniQ family protein [Echinimonas agarilytica]